MCYIVKISAILNNLYFLFVERIFLKVVNNFLFLLVIVEVEDLKFGVVLGEDAFQSRLPILLVFIMGEDNADLLLGAGS
jgi:hypothetical protein